MTRKYLPGTCYTCQKCLFCFNSESYECECDKNIKAKRNKTNQNLVSKFILVNLLQTKIFQQQTNFFLLLIQNFNIIATLIIHFLLPSVLLATVVIKGVKNRIRKLKGSVKKNQSK